MTDIVSVNVKTYLMTKKRLDNQIHINLQIPYTIASSGKWSDLEKSNKKNWKKFYSHIKTEISKKVYILPKKETSKKFYSSSKLEAFQFFIFHAETCDRQKRIWKIFVVIQKQKSLKTVLYIYLEKILSIQKHWSIFIFLHSRIIFSVFNEPYNLFHQNFLHQNHQNTFLWHQ